MLEDLNTVDWSQLWDLDGTAAELPKLVRTLGDTDQSASQQAIEELALRVWSESERSEVTPRVVPFLVKLALERTVAVRPQIISLLTRIAIGEERTHIPSGISPARYRADCTAREQRTREVLGQEGGAPAGSTGRLSSGDAPGVYSSWEWESYQAVEASVLELADLLRDQDDGVRNAAIHAVAWFPNHAERLLPMLYAGLISADSDAEMANALIAIGMLTRNAEPMMSPPDFTDLLATARPPLVRTAAALAMARGPLDNAVQDALRGYLLAPTSADEPEHPYAFNERHFIAHIALTLSIWWNDDIETVVGAVARGLEKSAFFGKYDTARALIDLGRPYAAPRLLGLVAPQLTNTQRRIMRAIADHGAWRFPFDRTQSWGNFAQMLRSNGLPDSQAAMRRMLAWRLCEPGWWRALWSS